MASPTLSFLTNAPKLHKVLSKVYPFFYLGEICGSKNIFLQLKTLLLFYSTTYHHLIIDYADESEMKSYRDAGHEVTAPEMFDFKQFCLSTLRL